MAGEGKTENLGFSLKEKVSFLNLVICLLLNSLSSSVMPLALVVTYSRIGNDIQGGCRA